MSDYSELTSHLRVFGNRASQVAANVIERLYEDNKNLLSMGQRALDQLSKEEEIQKSLYNRCIQLEKELETSRKNELILKQALEKIASYNRSIILNQINYRPEDHESVALDAIEEVMQNRGNGK